MKTFAVALVLAFAVLGPAQAAGPAGPCCFVNDRYEGTCTVSLGTDETCQSVLEYLNNPMSTGKSYCNRTSVRGGWVQVDCKTGKPLPPPDEKKPKSETQTRITRICTETN